MIEADISSLVVKKKLTGIIIRFIIHKKSVPHRQTLFSVGFSLGNLFFSFDMSLDTTVNEILQKIGKPCCVIEEKDGRRQILNSKDKPFQRAYAIMDGILLPRFSTHIYLARLQDISSSFAVLRAKNIIKLIICSVPVQELNIRELRKLRYLRLQNLGLRKLYAPAHRLQYANVSNNYLRSCSICSWVLDARNNRITRLSSTFPQDYLNLSNNPLKRLNALARILYIMNTRVKHPVSTIAHKVVADGTKSIQFGYCPNLRHLSISQCGLFSITGSAALTNILIARNNYLEDLPLLPNLQYADFSGNFLSEISNIPRLISADFSKNNLNNFSFSSFQQLLSVKLSFNPLESLDCYTHPQPRIHINSSIASVLSLSDPPIKQFHLCRPRNNFYEMCIVDGTIKGMQMSMISIFATDVECSPDFAGFWKMGMQTHSTIQFLECFAAKAMESLFIKDRSSVALFVVITPKDVLIKNAGLSCVFFNFSECKRVSRPDMIRTFSNCGRWLIIPTFCNLARGEESRFYTFHRKLEDLRPIFQFLNYFCPLGLEFSIRSSAYLVSRDESLTIRRKRRNKKWCKNASFESVLRQNCPFVWEKCSDYIGCSNIDFGMSFHQEVHNTPLINTSVPVFVFLKLIYGACLHPLLKAERYNILNIIDVYCKIFNGRCIEKSYLFYVVVFESPVIAALWGLRVKDTLSTVGVSVGVGITGDTVLRMQTAGRLRLCGPAFNKSSRIANSGIGIFCSSFLNVSHPSIETVDEGECFFKGFSERERIVSVRLRKSRDIR